jgi:large subunit ribosomal protein L18
MNKTAVKKVRTQKRKLRIKKSIVPKTSRPRLCISRSSKNFYAQVIDDLEGKTLVGLSTLSSDFKDMKNRGNIEAAKKLGKAIAEKAREKGISEVVFDRNGYLYHGKIKAFADAARENGLKF